MLPVQDILWLEVTFDKTESVALANGSRQNV